MITITVRYGLTKSATVEKQEPITVRQLLADVNLKALLGFPENVHAVIDGETASFDDYISDQAEVVLEKQAAAKA